MNFLITLLLTGLGRMRIVPIKIGLIKAKIFLLKIKKGKTRIKMSTILDPVRIEKKKRERRGDI
ncbi:MAG: hypothetical protein ABIN61_02340 [candidate division WOR-3 bacterium]